MRVVRIDEYRRMAEVENTHWWYRATNKHLETLLRTDLKRGGVMLDVGGGTGATGSWMAKYGSVVSLDMEPIASQLYVENHPDASAVVADAQQLPIANSSVDVVLCVTVLYHRAIVDPAVAVREFARVTKPGGVVCLWEPGLPKLRRLHDEITHAGRRFSVKQMHSLASDAGLVVERATGAHASLVAPAYAKSWLEKSARAKGDAKSDLDSNQTGLRGVLPAIAMLERKLIERFNLPTGLSSVVVARKPR